MAIEFKLPDLGENVEAGDVVGLLVSEGDDIEPEQNVIELETDKAVVEVPCPHGGRVTKIHVKEGDRLSIGEPILTIEESGDGASGKEDKEAEKDEGDEEDKKPETGDEEKGKAEEKGRKQKSGKAKEEKKTGKADTEEKQEKTEEKQEKQEKEEAEEEEEKAEKEEPEDKKKPRGDEEGEEPKSAGRSEESKEPAEDRPPAPAGPATRRLARELGVDLYRVKGSGPGGRIDRDDVKAHVKQAFSSGGGGLGGASIPPLPDFTRWGAVDRQPVKGIRRVTVESMSVAWAAVPHVTQFDQADITELEAARRRFDDARPEDAPKVTVTAVMVKACAIALKKFPRFNSSLDANAEELILKKYYHVGVAVDTDHGLIVPVIRDVDQKSITEIAGELIDVARRARQRKVDLSELKGGCFTVTNLGGIGGTGFTPIVNYPEVAILGMARSRRELVPGDEELESRLILPLSLSYDHRVIDGADGARFLRFVATLLEDSFQLLIEA